MFMSYPDLWLLVNHHSDFGKTTLSLKGWCDIVRREGIPCPFFVLWKAHFIDLLWISVQHLLSVFSTVIFQIATPCTGCIGFLYISVHIIFVPNAHMWVSKCSILSCVALDYTHMMHTLFRMGTLTVHMLRSSLNTLCVYCVFCTLHVIWYTLLQKNWMHVVFTK